MIALLALGAVALASLAVREIVSMRRHAGAAGAPSSPASPLDERARGAARAALRLGIPDRFIEHGERAELLADLGLDLGGICQAVRSATFVERTLPR